MKLSKRLEGINEYYFSQKLREIELMNQAGKQVLNLGIGSPDQPPHPSVIQVLEVESKKPNTHAYQSYKGSLILRNAISDWYKKWYTVELNPASEILPLIGSKEGLMHICMTYLDEECLALIPNPGYPTYQSAAKISGAVVSSYTLLEANDWQINLEEIAILIGNKKWKNILLFVNYPHMPTGQIPITEKMQKLVDFAKEKGILIVHDNPYSFILNNKPQSLLQYKNAKDVVIELNSLSKSHNMAGWRIGMICGSTDKIDQILTFKSNMDSGMFLPLQLAAAQALTLGEEWHDSLNKIYAERKEKVFELLNELGCVYNKNQAGMFVWAAIPALFESGFQLADKVLSEAFVFITPGGIFGSAGNKYIRISLCCSIENITKAIERIKVVKQSILTQ